MDLLIMKKHDGMNSENFRVPLSVEKEIGLWVDRIGSGHSRGRREFKLRSLDLYAAFYIERGKGIFFTEKTSWINLGQGDTVLLFPDIPVFYCPDDAWDTKWIVWDGPEAAKMESMGFFNPSYPVMKSNENSVLFAHKRLSELICSEDMASLFERKVIIVNMLFDLYKSMTSNEPDVHNGLMEKAVSLMNNSVDKDIPVNYFASCCGLSEVHFRRLFKRYTGKSPKDFIISSKVSRAKEYLSQGKSIKQTAVLLGFSDMFYFMRLFKKASGVTPGKFQQTCFSSSL